MSTTTAAEALKPRKRSARTRERILDSAAAVLADRGYSGLRIQDVAALAEVRPAAIYYYFDSREALVEEVLWSGMARLREHVTHVVAACGPATSGLDRMLAATEAHLRRELDISEYAQASIRNAGHVPDHLRRRNVIEAAAYRDLWQGLLDEAIADGSVPPGAERDLAIRFVVGALNWTAEWCSPERGGIERLVATALVFVRRGLTGAAETTRATPEVACCAKPPAGTRERILAAAAAVLRHRGYATTKLAEIAELADVQAPAIYHYFGSRQELLQAVMTEGNRAVLSHVRERLASLPRDAGARDTIACAVAAHLEVELELSDFAAAVIRNTGQAPGAVRQSIARDAGAYHDLWRVLLADAAGEGLLHHGIDAGTARMLVHGALNWATEWWHPGIPVDSMVRAAQTLVVGGLLGP